MGVAVCSFPHNAYAGVVSSVVMLAPSLAIGEPSRGWLVPMPTLEAEDPLQYGIARPVVASGEVRLVTSSAVYLSLAANGGGTTVVSLHPLEANVPRSPVSVHLALPSAFARYSVEVGDRATITKGSLTICARYGHVRIFDLLEASVWTPKAYSIRLTAEEASSMRATMERSLEPFLLETRFLLGTKVSALSNALYGSTSFSSTTQNHRLRLVVAVDALVGFGPGLTPSGDDVLAGCLLGLSAWGGRPDVLRQFREVVLHSLIRANATTFVAEQLLRLACSGFGNEAIDDVMVGGCARDPIATREAARRLLAVGATSGADSILGLLIALELIERTST
jgi:Protein of unknown function (DUF2877)